MDAHTHAHFLPDRDLELMYLAGVRELVICSFVPLARRAETLMDHFEEMVYLHKQRLSEMGFAVHVFIGIHPRNIVGGWRRLIPVIEEFVSKGLVNGIGEVGLEIGDATEVEVLREQLRIAREYGLPVIIHTPRDNRVSIVKRIVEVVRETRIEPSRVVIDHVSDDIIDAVNAAGAVPGLSIKPGLLSPCDIAERLERYENGVLNSDSIHINDTDPLAVPRTVAYLERVLQGEHSVIERLAYSNACEWLRGN
ncbi:TatD-related deoxyribonuclease [Pyrolobus fumarii 1A]|uniref:TatD-related deoxyribonuclease n=1 Tax=Pyrolobus fumarii (strain DSM 11204 / 1A) TaxID=694429 RepID=G0EFH3_PYRF1|nr:TatD-related deoxyribonuclease [Pyrolobus fumarii 1A]